METKNIKLSSAALRAIIALRHPQGTYTMYKLILSRLFNYIMEQYDEIGMSDREALETLRVVHLLRIDLSDLAGRTNDEADPVVIEADDADCADIAARVNAAFGYTVDDDNPEDNKESSDDL